MRGLRRLAAFSGCLPVVLFLTTSILHFGLAFPFHGTATAPRPPHHSRYSPPYFQSNRQEQGLVGLFKIYPSLSSRLERSRSSSCLVGGMRVARSDREGEIRRKIMELKRQGRIVQNKSEEDTAAAAAATLAAYEEKVRTKLGTKKSRLLGIGKTSIDEDVASIEAELDSYSSIDDVDDDDDVTDLDDTDFDMEPSRDMMGDSLDSQQVDSLPDKNTLTSRLSIDPSLFPETKFDSPELSEEELVDLVAAKLAEKQMQQQQQQQTTTMTTTTQLSEPTTAIGIQKSLEKTTTGVGGTWQEDGSGTQQSDMYKPKTGSWGAFPRPKDISKAYGGGRRVGAGFSKEEDTESNMNTQKRLQEYRRKVGIDVPTEKEHAAEIQEALQIGQLAMQRGVYATAVSALEKVTKWCSTNSPVGSKVFLELAMAYEATGRTKEAYQVYKTLTTCRMEDVKFNAKRLLYGLEAMEFMRDVSSDFSRQKIKNTFIDTTGLANIAQNFDDVYQTAYVDLDNGYYKRLTESVVRSNREARQILLKATGKGEVGRMKVVQALRSLSRHFDEALEKEALSSRTKEPTVFINGKPLVMETQQDNNDNLSAKLDEFVLASPDQMMDNLEGSWRLQLLADKQGDGVSFFNTTTAIQKFSTTKMSFAATGPSGFVQVKCSGKLRLDEAKRVLDRSDINTEGVVGFFGLFGSTTNSGFLAAVSRSQQIISVDSTLLITKSPLGSRKGKDAEKEHFAVWRRIADQQLE